MKFILSLSLISLSFLASANMTESFDATQKTSIETALYPGGPGKRKARKGKRTNKRRKRACGKWARRSYAG